MKLLPLLFLFLTPHPTDDPGMLGLFFEQIYSESRADHRGPLAVMYVMENSPAAQAGVHCSDVVTAINGVPVAGRILPDIMRHEIRGPVGGTVRFTVVHVNGTQSELTLTRAPYPPHTPLPSDSFTYSVPGSWTVDNRYTFPLPWSPELSYHGFEDIYFSPDFDQTDSPEYHSYLFFLFLDGHPAINAEQLQSDMLVYFRGLAKQRGTNNNFTPDLSKIAAHYSEDSSAPTFGATPARSFSGSVTIYDTHGKLITLNSEVVSSTCPDSRTVLFFGMSLEPRSGPMWTNLHSIRDTFHCR
jgi:hypothetical protein